MKKLLIEKMGKEKNRRSERSPAEMIVVEQSSAVRLRLYIPQPGSN